MAKEFIEITNEILDKAYKIYEEWGPNRRIKRIERMRDSFKDFSSEQLDYIIEKMEMVNKTVWEIAEMGGVFKVGEEKVIQLLQEKHSFLQSEGLRHAEFLINYYAWHEGYDK